MAVVCCGGGDSVGHDGALDLAVRQVGGILVALGQGTMVGGDRLGALVAVLFSAPVTGGAVGQSVGCAMGEPGDGTADLAG